MADSPYTQTLPEISRPFLEAEIERLISMLDDLDDDPDLESTGDEEPWLGAFENSWFIGRGTNWSLDSQGDDREEECEDEGAQCDDEGAIDCDREPDNDDEEDSRELLPHVTEVCIPGMAVQS